MPLVWHEYGEGRPVLLLHGLFSSAHTNWLKYGHASTIATQGFRLIMPDLRGHGESGKPHDPTAYPPDILARDGLELIEQLGLSDYDLGGYSLGARTAVRMIVLGAKPRRLVNSGMGLEGLLNARARSGHFKEILSGLGSHSRGSPEWMAEAFLKTNRGDPEAMMPLLDSIVDTSVGELRAIAIPTLVLAGSDDHDNGSSQALAEMLPDARLMEISGNHMSAVTKPELGVAIADFLAA